MKILIAYVAAGAGHQRAAEAVGAAFHQLGVPHKVTVLNATEKTDACYQWSFTRGYVGLIRHFPFLWGFLYHLTDLRFLRKAVQGLHRISNRWHGKPFEDYLLEARPDLFIGTHFFSAEVAAAVKSRHHLPMRVVTVITDYLPHILWLAPGVDTYVVASDETKEAFLRRGIPGNQIEVLGIPIDPKFNQRISRPLLAKKLGIDPDRFTILIGSGGLGTGPIVSLVEALAEVIEPIQLLVVAGKNSALFEHLENMRCSVLHPMKIYGFINNMDELMEVSDVMVSKPGGLTCAEAMAKGLPLIVVAPIPGQETRNMRFLQELGLAVFAPDVKTVPRLIREFIADPQQLRAISQNTREKSFPEAAVHVAQLGLR